MKQTRKPWIATLLLLAWLNLVLPVPAAPAQGQGPVSIVAPTSGTTVSAGEKVSVQVLLRRDIQGKATAVQVMCDGRGVGLLNAPPFVATLDTSGFKPGRYVIEASAFLSNGNKVAATPIELVIAGGSGSVIPEDTPVLLSTMDKLVSGDTPTGSEVRLRVERDVIAPDGKILIPEGAKATGEVVKSEGSGFFGKEGSLDFTLRTVTAADGTVVPIRASRSMEGDDNLGGVVAGAVLLSVFFVFLSGSDVEIPPGTLITGYVSRNVDIAHPAPAKADSAALRMERSVTITSPADGARIEPTDKMTFACNVVPADPDAYIRLYLDDRQLVGQTGHPDRIEWRGPEDLKSGEHILEAEVTFSMGKVVKSAPIKFTVSD